MTMVYAAQQVAPAWPPTTALSAPPLSLAPRMAPTAYYAAFGGAGHAAPLALAAGQLNSRSAPTLPPGSPQITARDRKQVMMHSTLFQNNGPAVHNAYHQARQLAVVEEMRSMAEGLPKRSEVVLPHPADYKATVNQGHWVVTPRCPAGSGACPLGHAEAALRPVAEGYTGHRSTCSNNRHLQAVEAASGGNERVLMQFGNDMEPVHLVRAARSGGGITKEQWATHTNVAWDDSRMELQVMRRGQEFHNSRRDMPASARKMQELSSEVLGSARNIEKSTQSPSKELRSMHLKDVHCVDSSLDKTAPQEHHQRLADSRRLSARERSHNNLSVSSGSPFPRRAAGSASSPNLPLAAPPNLSGAAGSPRRSPRGTTAEEDLDALRRRAERNYSDIFFDQPASARPKASEHSPRREISRGEPAGASNGSFLDPGVEIVRKQSRGSPRNGARDENGSPGSVAAAMAMWSKEDCSPNSQHSPRSPMSPGSTCEERKHHHQERACWDTTSIMSTGAEIARRRRERLHPDGAASPPADRSASERKRVELASSQVRCGQGASPAPWDDGRGSAPAPPPRPSHHSRSSTDSKAAMNFRNVRPDTARARKVESLMSNGVF